MVMIWSFSQSSPNAGLSSDILDTHGHALPGVSDAWTLGWSNRRTQSPCVPPAIVRSNDRMGTTIRGVKRDTGEPTAGGIGVARHRRGVRSVGVIDAFPDGRLVTVDHKRTCWRQNAVHACVWGGDGAACIPIDSEDHTGSECARQGAHPSLSVVLATFTSSACRDIAKSDQNEIG